MPLSMLGRKRVVLVIRRFRKSTLKKTPGDRRESRCDSEANVGPAKVLMTTPTSLLNSPLTQTGGCAVMVPVPAHGTYYGKHTMTKKCWNSWQRMSPVTQLYKKQLSQ